MRLTWSSFSAILVCISKAVKSDLQRPAGLTSYVARTVSAKSAFSQCAIRVNTESLMIKELFGKLPANASSDDCAVNVEISAHQATIFVVFSERFECGVR